MECGRWDLGRSGLVLKQSASGWVWPLHLKQKQYNRMLTLLNNIFQISPTLPWKNIRFPWPNQFKMSNSSRRSNTKSVFYIHAARKLERDQKLLTMQGTVGRLFFTSRLSLRAAWNYERKALRTETLATHVSEIEARQSLYQHRLTVFADNRVRHMICLS